GKVLGGDRTRVSLHALASTHDHISKPAAAFLARSGDAAALVARLGAVKSAEVRRELREGLIRRGALPLPELAGALRSPEPAARTEAAWIAGNAGEAARARRRGGRGRGAERGAAGAGARGPGAPRRARGVLVRAVGRPPGRRRRGRGGGVRGDRFGRR